MSKINGKDTVQATPPRPIESTKVGGRNILVGCVLDDEDDMIIESIRIGSNIYNLSALVFLFLIQIDMNGSLFVGSVRSMMVVIYQENEEYGVESNRP
mmetsp:Transcript_65016/g.72646  ORF Transcript_65016/g.72646 Transcript_65016/m.72646 type:complete len:98 (+) Transcript_65016:1193-1486(+)